jgi:hypothetical protein
VLTPAIPVECRAGDEECDGCLPVAVSAGVVIYPGVHLC